jgi:hypothetical protein
MTQVRALGGAMADVDPDATAFADRHQSAMIIGTVFSPGRDVTAPQDGLRFRSTGLRSTALPRGRRAKE